MTYILMHFVFINNGKEELSPGKGMLLVCEKLSFELKPNVQMVADGYSGWHDKQYWLIWNPVTAFLHILVSQLSEKL